MNKKADLADAIRSAGGGTRRRLAQQEETQSRPEEPSEQGRAQPYQQPSRQKTRPITAHFPKEVRDQLKILAVEQDKTMQDLLAESLNDLFAKYGKPEIAPQNKGR